VVKIGRVISGGKKLLRFVFANALFHFGMALQVIGKAFSYYITL